MALVSCAACASYIACVPFPAGTSKESIYAADLSRLCFSRGLASHTGQSGWVMTKCGRTMLAAEYMGFDTPSVSAVRARCDQRCKRGKGSKAATGPAEDPKSLISLWSAS